MADRVVLSAPNALAHATSPMPFSQGRTNGMFARGQQLKNCAEAWLPTFIISGL